MTTTKKSWGDVLPVHPAALAFIPRQSNEKLTEIGESIRARGMTTPIVIFRELNDRHDLKCGYKYSLLDGISRFDGMTLVGLPFKLNHTKRDGWTLEIEGEFGLPIPDPLIVDATDVDPWDFVLAANAHRRHLDAEDLRKVIAAYLKAHPEKSDRRIAQTVKASPTTVGKIRKEGEATGDVSTVDTRTDSKGRQQPAHKPPPPHVAAAVDRAIASWEANQYRQASAGNGVDPAASALQRKAEAATEPDDATIDRIERQKLADADVGEPEPNGDCPDDPAEFARLAIGLAADFRNFSPGGNFAATPDIVALVKQAAEVWAELAEMLTASDPDEGTRRAAP